MNIIKLLKKHKIIIIIILIIIIIIFYIIKNNNNKKKKKIAVCTWYDNGIKKYADIAKDINQKYCDLHGYDLIIKHERKLKERQQQWECIPAVLDIVEENKYEYIVWIDADAVFRLNHDKFNLLETYINKNKDKDFILSADVPGYDIINTGVFIVKSNDYTKNILKNIIKSELKECKNYNKFGHEQECMCHFFKNNINNFKINTIILEEGILQSWHKANKYINKVYDNSLILHLAGVNNEKRYEIFKNLKENDYSSYF